MKATHWTARLGMAAGFGVLGFSLAGVAVALPTPQTQGSGAVQVPTLEAGFDDPDVLVDQICAALARGDFRGFFRLHDPAALEGTKQAVNRLVEVARQEEDAALAIRHMGLESWDDLDSSSAVEILGRMTDWKLSEDPDASMYFKRSCGDVIGRVEETPDLLHYILRAEKGSVGAEVKLVVLQSVGRTPNGWMALPSSELSEIFQLLEHLAETLEADDGPRHEIEEGLAQETSGEQATAPDTVMPIVPDPSVTLPVMLDRPQPVYPESARLERVQGKAVLQATIDVEGHVAHVKLLRSSGDERLDGSAMTGVRQWRYEPATKDGQPVAVYFTVVVDFALE